MSRFLSGSGRTYLMGLFIRLPSGDQCRNNDVDMGRIFDLMICEGKP